MVGYGYNHNLPNIEISLIYSNSDNTSNVQKIGVLSKSKTYYSMVLAAHTKNKHYRKLAYHNT